MGESQGKGTGKGKGERGEGEATAKGKGEVTPARIERILKEKPLAWRDRLEKMLDEAVERGNKKSVGRALKGLFVIRYDDEGRLLLKEEDFK